MDHLLAPPDTGSVLGFRPVPSDDAAFDAAIKAAVDGCLASALADSLRCITAKLRIRYPMCTLRPQEELAAFPGAPPVVYVYRDGTEIP